MNLSAPQIIGQHFLKSSTGILTLKSDSFTKTIHFERGFCTFATSNIYEDRMGEKLIEWGVLSEAQFAKASEVMRQNQWKLGKALVYLEYLNESQLIRFIQRQIKEIIFSTFALPPIEFRFDSCTLPDYEHKLQLEVPQIVLEGMRRITDTQLLEKLFPDQDLKVELNIQPQTLFERVTMEPQEAYLVSILENGSQTIRSLVLQGAVSSTVTYATLYALSCVGMLRLTPSATSRETTSDLETQKFSQFCYEIESKINAINNNCSYYQLLEIDKNCSPPDIRKAYAELSNKFNPARQAELSRYNIDMRAHLERISTHLTRAAQTLLNADSRRDYDACLAQIYQHNIATLDVETLRLLTAPDESSLQDLNETQLERTMSKQEVSEFCAVIDDKVRLIKSGATYYQLLELPNHTKVEDIENSYRRLAQKFNLVKQMHLSPFGYDKREELDQIGQNLRKAYNVLMDPQAKLNYDQSIYNDVRRTGSIPILKSSPPASTPAPSINRLTSQVVQPPTSLRAQPVQPLRAQPVQPLQTPAHRAYSAQAADPLQPRVSTAPAKSNSFKAAEVYIKAIEAEDAGRYDEASILMRRVVQLAPKDPHYWSHLGKILSQDPRNFREAESSIREAIRLDPKDPDYYAELGTLYRKHNNHQKAIEMFEKALEINSNHNYSKRALSELRESEPKPKPKNGGLLSKFGF